MASFITRVELHNAKAEDYEKLHEYMEEEGFSRTITSDDEVAYYLPTAEYELSGELTRSQILQKAKSAASKTTKSFCALVTQSAGQSCYGLKQVK